jgi:hypothetical protein
MWFSKIVTMHCWMMCPPQEDEKHYNVPRRGHPENPPLWAGRDVQVVRLDSPRMSLISRGIYECIGFAVR